MLVNERNKRKTYFIKMLIYTECLALVGFIFMIVLFIKRGIHNYIKVKIRGIFTISYKAA